VEVDDLAIRTGVSDRHTRIWAEDDDAGGAAWSAKALSSRVRRAISYEFACSLKLRPQFSGLAFMVEDSTECRWARFQRVCSAEQFRPWLPMLPKPDKVQRFAAIPFLLLRTIGQVVYRGTEIVNALSALGETLCNLKCTISLNH
jgi:hypothetical protein